MISTVPVLLFIFGGALSARASLIARQNVPDCIPKCVSILYQDACPDSTDAKCFCSQTHFDVDMFLCLGTFCDAADHDNAVQSVDGVCSDAGVPVTLGPADTSISDGPTSTSSSDATVSSTSTSVSSPSVTSTSKTSSPTSASRTPTTTVSAPTQSKGGAVMNISDKWAITWVIGVLAITL